jgi:hypothetical protein
LLCPYNPVGGLWATYFDDASLDDAFRRASRLDAAIAFAWGGSGATGVGLSNPLRFSARWSGMLRPSFAEVYTFTFAVDGTDEGLRVTFDNLKILDLLTGVAATSVTCTISVPTANSFYQVTLEYAQRTGTAQFAASFASPSQGPLSLSSARLYYSTPLISAPAFDLYPRNTHPLPLSLMETDTEEAFCAAASTLKGPSLSLLTQGVAGTFTLSFRDVFSNPTPPLVEVFASASSAKASQPPLQTSTSSLPILFLEPTPSATLSVAAALKGGLFATFYDTHTLAAPRAVRAEGGVDFSTSGAAPHASLTSSSIFSVRWGGFLRPTVADEYALGLVFVAADERARLLVDGAAVVDAWTAQGATRMEATLWLGANSHFDLRVEFKSGAASHGLSLTWRSAIFSTRAVPSAVLYIPYHLGGSPFALSITSSLWVLAFILTSKAVSARR